MTEKDGRKDSEEHKAAWKSSKEKDNRIGLPELKGNIYVYESDGQVDRYMKTTTAIADHVRTTISPEMWSLVHERLETKFDEPTIPGDTATPGELRRYEILLKSVIERELKYKSDKGRVFGIIIGQCHPIMRSSVEALPEFKKWQTEYDVCSLLNAMRTLVHHTEETHYEYWTMQIQQRNMFKIIQGPTEPLTNYCRRFLEQLEMTEETWGPLIPGKMNGKTKDEQEEARERYLACVLLGGTDPVRYRSTMNDLCNDFLHGDVHYPKTMTKMVGYLANRKGKGNPTKRNDTFRRPERREKDKSMAQLPTEDEDTDGPQDPGDDDSVTSETTPTSRASSNSGKQKKKKNKKDKSLGQLAWYM
jgi:hypothetical protein